MKLIKLFVATLKPALTAGTVFIASAVTLDRYQAIQEHLNKSDNILTLEAFLLFLSLGILGLASYYLFIFHKYLHNVALDEIKSLDM